MRITILTWSTRGEVQPYAALGHELELRGHRVVLAVNENHVNWARRTGLSVAPLPLDCQALMTAESARACLTSGETGTFLSLLAEDEHARRLPIAQAMIDACTGADAIVSGFLVGHRAAAIAEANDVAFVRAFIYPVAPTSAYASPYLASGMQELPRAALRRLRSHERAQPIFLQGQRADLDEMRARLRVHHGDHARVPRPPLVGSAEDDITRRAVRTVHLFDERVLPRPDDLPADFVVSGYCFLPRELRDRIGESGLDSGLDTWLDAGPARIFFGFGSTPVSTLPRRSIWSAICARSS
jgi:sterol 3beta-glucosyltransferase